MRAIGTDCGGFGLVKLVAARVMVPLVTFLVVSGLLVPLMTGTLFTDLSSAAFLMELKVVVRVRPVPGTLLVASVAAVLVVPLVTTLLTVF